MFKLGTAIGGMHSHQTDLHQKVKNKKGLTNLGLRAPYHVNPAVRQHIGTTGASSRDRKVVMRKAECVLMSKKWIQKMLQSSAQLHTPL